MSSLQKFHRRTQPFGPITWPAIAIGGGDETHGYWLGDISSNKLIVAPKTTELTGANSVWGQYGYNTGVRNTTDGLANTNTLYALGSTYASAAYYCKTLNTGGYNTWYLPAINELLTFYSNKNRTPFATANAIPDSHRFWSSTENNGGSAGVVMFDTGQLVNGGKGPYANTSLRAIRRTTI